MGSSRLPGKVLRMAAGKPFLQHHLERLKRSRFADDVWVATTTLAQDDAIVSLCRDLGVACFRGSATDVLSRYHGAMRASGANRVVRVTSDCPLIDPTVVDEAIARMNEDPVGLDYVSNTLVRSYPRGLDCEVIRASALEDAQRNATREEEREHVTPYVYWRPDRFRIDQIVSPVNLSHHRWTVDTSEDEELVRRLLEAALQIDPHFGLPHLLNVVAAHPDWPAINAHVEQKKIHR
jgi:spore coat polysaccharide biosynthesis protein SpsF